MDSVWGLMAKLRGRVKKFASCLMKQAYYAVINRDKPACDELDTPLEILPDNEMIDNDHYQSWRLISVIIKE